MATNIQDFNSIFTPSNIGIGTITPTFSFNTQGNILGDTTTIKSQPQVTPKSSVVPPPTSPKLPSTQPPSPTSSSNDVINAMIRGGYDRASAESVYGSDPERFTREYLGGGQGIDQQQNAEIESAYQAALNYANQAEEAQRGAMGRSLEDIQGQYETGVSTLGQGRQKALGTLQESRTQAKQREETALAAATRLYNELRQGYGQRFGGATSAGEAARSLSGIEQQRQFGQVRQTTSDAMRQLGNQQIELETNYNTQLQQLQQSMNQAKNQVQNEFMSNLLTINQSRAESAQAKAQARLTALTDLRNKMFAIAQQETAFKQNLEAMKEQARLSLGQGFGQTTGTIPTIQTGLNVGQQGGSQTPTSNLTGYARPLAQYNPGSQDYFLNRIYNQPTV